MKADLTFKLQKSAIEVNNLPARIINVINLKFIWKWAELKAASIGAKMQRNIAMVFISVKIV